MAQTPRHFRIFISSPGDVVQERHIAWEVIDALPDRPVFRDRVTFRVIAWDRPGSDTPLLAKLTPQEAINMALPMPSECDIVIVILWSRMGTPFTLDGREYLSGTQYEYLDAVQAEGTEVVVYRRTEKVEIALDDPNLAEKREQYERVEAFFATFSDPVTGQARRGANYYATPDDFRQKFETHLEAIVQRLLETAAPPGRAARDAEAGVTAASKVWEGSPFPGLRAFTDADAPIFFGRGAETDALVKRLEAARFVGVAGVSGSGKSSLVGAGLLPRLRANAVEGSKDWLLPAWNTEVKQWTGLRFTPGEAGDNPFTALALRLIPCLEPPAESAPALAQRLAEQPARIGEYVNAALAGRPAWAEILFFVDQFEELFTAARPDLRAPFIQMLSCLAEPGQRARVVATLRADFYSAVVEDPALALLFASHHALPAPPLGALYEMIVRPAERAALAFEDGLPDQILADTGGEPGALALMAYLLDELYRVRGGDRALTFAKYRALGGVQGAVAQRAEHILGALSPAELAALPVVFHSLAQIDDRGAITRRRAARSEVTATPAAAALVDAFTNARLLVTGGGQGEQPVVEVAHEALLTNWPRLRQELDADREFLLWRQQLRRDVQAWLRDGRGASYLYTGARLIVADRWREQRAERLAPDDLAFLDASRRRRSRRRAVFGSALGLFALLFALAAPFVTISVYNEALRQQAIAAAPVATFAAAEALLGPDDETVLVPAFALDRYEVSRQQYERCVLARACAPAFVPTFDDAGAQPDKAQHPVTSVNAYQAHTFCRWLGRRLPTAAELERAGRGTDGRLYPWSDDAQPDPSRVNALIEGYPDRAPSGTVAVNDAAYQDGATRERIMHLLGNAAEWTATPAGCGVTCTEFWDGEQATALERRGWGWANSFLRPAAAVSPLAEAQVTEASYADIDIGFRCAQDTKGEGTEQIES